MNEWAMNIRRWAFLTALPLLLWAAALPASAHPHVWIEMRSDLVFNDQGQVTAMNLEWTFDDGYAQMALAGLDTNGDGVITAKECLAAVKNGILRGSSGSSNSSMAAKTVLTTRLYIHCQLRQYQQLE